MHRASFCSLISTPHLGSFFDAPASPIVRALRARAVNELMKKHEKAFGEIKNYYNDITHNNLDLIRSLKEEVRSRPRREAPRSLARSLVSSHAR